MRRVMLRPRRQRHSLSERRGGLGFGCGAGKHMVLGGAKGHLAVMEWSKAHLVTELQVKETVRDVCFLHNEKFFAAAQRKYVYVYDKRGLEIHCLREHTEVRSERPRVRCVCGVGERCGGLLSLRPNPTGG